MSSLFQDLRFALRVLLKNPGFSGIAVLTLALGIAANVLIFSIFNTLFLRPLPFKEPSRLVDLDETAPRWHLEFTSLAYPNFDAWRRLNHTFEGMAAYSGATCHLSDQGNTERISAIRVTHDMASVLGTTLAMGRFFTTNDDRPGASGVLLLSHGFWQRHFGGREVLGQTLQLDHQPFTIIGVLSHDRRDFLDAEIWVPLAKDPAVWDGWNLGGIGRLKRGVTLSMAREDLLQVRRNLLENHQTNENTQPRLTPLAERWFDDYRPVNRVLMGAVALVLLIACANVASLMLARGLARFQELGIRAALGATPWRIARLLGAESLVLAAGGGLLGLWLGNWGLETLIASLPPGQIPHWLRFELDWRVGFFTLLLVFGAALLAGVPAIRSVWSAHLQEAMRSSAAQSSASPARRRGLHVLVVAEVALTLVLLIQAALLLQAFRSLQRTDPGFRPDHLLVYRLDLPDYKYNQPEARPAFYQNHLEQVRALPGVTAAGAIDTPPLGGHTGTFWDVEGAPPKGPKDPNPVVLRVRAWPGYFETMAIPILAGRSFTEQDGRNEGALAVIVSETFAKRSWPGQDPIGKRIRNEGGPWIPVVGVAKDVKHYGVDQEVRPTVYLPYAQATWGDLAVVIRCSVPPLSLVPAVRALVRQVDPEALLYGVDTFEAILTRALWARRLYAALIGIFAGVALVMAVGGIYGVFCYMVNRRTHELGIRLALGAPRPAVLWLVLRQGMTLAGLGIGLGLVGGLLAAPLMQSQLFGVKPIEPVTFAGISVLLALVALLACYLPARRATLVDPLTALRAE
jgi:putative ABC transport system permease protein